MPPKKKAAAAGTTPSVGATPTGTANDPCNHLLCSRLQFCPIEGFICLLCGVVIKLSRDNSIFQSSIRSHLRSTLHTNNALSSGSGTGTGASCASLATYGLEALGTWAEDFANLNNEQDMREKIEQNLGPEEKCKLCSVCGMLLHPNDYSHGTRKGYEECKGHTTKPVVGRKSKNSEYISASSWPRYVRLDEKDVNGRPKPLQLDHILHPAVHEKVEEIKHARFRAAHGELEEQIGQGGQKAVYKTSMPGEAFAFIDTHKSGETSDIGSGIHIILSSCNCPHIHRIAKWSSSQMVPSQLVVELGDAGSLDSNRYRHVVTEIVNGGDLRKFVDLKRKEWFERHKQLRSEKIEEGNTSPVLAPDVVRSLFFQIVVALYVVAVPFGIMHNDLKPENILVQHCKEGFSRRYVVGGQTFHFSATPTSADAVILKLTDFDQSMFWGDGKPFNGGRWGTLPYTPIDVFLLGNGAVYGHHRDLFGLGLVLLHLALGGPYYLLLRKTRCPNGLKTQWDEILLGNPAYSVLADAVKRFANGPHSYLADTLYHFLVLFGIEQINRSIAKTPMEGAITAMLSGSGPDAGQYAKDCEQFSVKHGANRDMKLARKALTDEGIDMVVGLCSFDPNKRPGAADILKNSPYLRNLRDVAGAFARDDDKIDFTYP